MRKSLLSLMLMIVSLASMGENKVQQLYMFGFAASFNDSTVYFTDIQRVDSAYIDTKTKFLIERENYSYQLRDHLKKQGWITPTCVTTYAKSRDDAEKKFVAMKKKYAGNQHYTIKYIPASEFQFEAITPTEVVYVTSNDSSAKADKPKKDKDKKKKDKQDGRPTPPDGAPNGGERPMGPPPSGMQPR